MHINWGLNFYKYFSIFLSLLLTISFASSSHSSPIDDYSQVLQNVNSSGFVNYKALKNNRQNLDSYLKHLNETNLPELDKNTQLATLINAYNAFAINGVLRRYPIKSVRKNFLDNSFFKNAEHNLEGKKVSLDAVESRIRSFNDPRIHFAIVCSSFSCPRLRNQAFTAANLNRFLDEAATEFANSDKHVSVNGKIVAVNPIMKWYRKDWGSTELEYLNKYRKDKLPKGTKIVYKKYNWSLNEAK